MLTVDPLERMTAAQLLKHEFLADADTVDVYWDAHAANEALMAHQEGTVVVKDGDEDEDEDEDEQEGDGNDDISTEEEEEVFRSKVEVRAE